MHCTLAHMRQLRSLLMAIKQHITHFHMVGALFKSSWIYMDILLVNRFRMVLLVENDWKVIFSTPR